MSAPLWVIAVCMVFDRLISIRGLRAKGYLRPIKAARDRLADREKPRPLSPTNMP